MSIDIPATAKKYARDLFDKMTEKRCAHLSDLEEAFTRALTEAAPKTNPWGYPVAMLVQPNTGMTLNRDFAGLIRQAQINGKYSKWNNGTFPPRPADEDDGA